MKYIIKILVAAVCLVAILFALIRPARAESYNLRVNQCQSEMVWKAIGWGAAYGGAVGFLATGAAVLLAPAGAIAAPVVVVINGTIYGGLIGAGGSASGIMYTIESTGVDPYAVYCLKKVLKDGADSALSWGRRALPS